MNRRTAIKLGGVALTATAVRVPAASNDRVTALCLNEDPNHFFHSRSQKRVTKADLLAWVDQYAGTQVRELMLCVNAQRTAYASKVWTPFWKDYDPQGPDGQPLFASQPAEAQKAFRAWVHTAWQMNQDGLDHFRIWIERAREKSMSPWLSIRMNDLHNVDDERHSLHSDFWRAHPEYRRIPYRGEMRDKALDFGHAAVRDYTFGLIEEVSKRYDFDGLELDWMRHGFHFAPGREAEGREHLNRFMQRVRGLLGRRRKIGVRVPPHPDTALRLGMDAVAWARAGCCDLVVPCNFWRTLNTDLPIRLWRQLLPASCLLGAGLELGLNPHLASKTFEGKAFGYNTLKTVRGAASAFLEQGADRVYLFNYMDSETAIEDLKEYPPMLREAGQLRTLDGKPRRHVVTYTDTWAPGEPQAYLLPAVFEAGRWRAFRVATGPAEVKLRVKVRIGLKGEIGGWVVRVNGVEATLVGLEQPERPWSDLPVYGFAVPAEALRDGDTVVEVTARGAGTVEWVEVARY